MNIRLLFGSLGLSFFSLAAVAQQTPKNAASTPKSDVEQAALNLLADSLSKTPKLIGLTIYLPDTKVTTRSAYTESGRCFADKGFEEMIAFEKAGKFERELFYPLQLTCPASILAGTPAKAKSTDRLLTPLSHILLKDGKKADGTLTYTRYVEFMLTSPKTENVDVIVVGLDENLHLKKWCMMPLN